MFGIAKLAAFAQPQLRLVRGALRFMKVTLFMLIYRFLGLWVDSDFDADYAPEAVPPKSLEDIPEADRPMALDRAALHFCMGGPFHPGCEMTWPMRHLSMYRAPFRLQERKTGGPADDYGEYLTQAT